MNAFAGCSTYLGFATINELNKDLANGNDNAGDFIEVKILDTSIPLSVYGTWTLTIQEDGGQGPAVFPLSGFDDTTVPWLVQSGLDVAIYIDLDAGMNVILKDGAGDVIDYLDYDTSDSFTALADGSCSSFVFGTTVASSLGGIKRISRSPDGIGAWGTVTAQSEAATESTTNDDVPGGAPTASVANLTVVPGVDATFTVTLSAAPSSDVIINYSTQDGTATAGSDYTSASGTVTIEAGLGPLIDQYAASVADFSSEWDQDGPVDYRAIQALGVPDTFSYGDIKTSWSPLAVNGGVEYITVKFSTPVYSTGVTIRETWGNGFVTQIDALDLNNTLNTVWSAVDDSAPGSPVDFLASWTQTDYLVDGIKITIDTTHNTSTWEEIDSIQLHGYSGSPTTAQFTINTSSSATSDEVFNVLLSSEDAIVLTSIATATFIATACGPVDSTYGLYSESGITFGDTVTMNGSSVSSGTTSGTAGLATDGSVSTSSIDIPAIDPSAFPANSATQDADDTNSPISGVSEVFYDEIFVNDSQDLFFTGSGPFHINTMTLDVKADIHLAAGTYYIDTLNMGDTSHLRVTSSPVIIHINTTLNMGEPKIHINEHDAGSPEDLQIYLHSGATISGISNNTETKMKAIIIGNDNGAIDFGTKLTFDGVILSNGAITVGTDSDIDLTSAHQSAIGAVTTCSDGSDGGGGSPGNLCSDIFAAGVQMSSATGTLEFESGGELQGNPSLELVTPTINKNHANSCSTGQCTASGGTSTDFVPLSFESSSSTTNLFSGGTFTVGDSGDNEYAHIKVENNGELTFSSLESTYRITKLEAKTGATINFAPGDYFIGELKTNSNNLVINVVGTGTVRIWATNEVKFKGSAIVNSPSSGSAGDPSQLVIHSITKVKVEGGSTVTGFLGSDGDVEVKGTSTVFGVLTSDKKIKVKENSVVSYLANEVGNTDFGGACNQVVVVSLNHFGINHDGNGINCLPEVIGVTAFDSTPAAVTDYTEQITLDTQSGTGTWTLASGAGAFTDATANDGLALYTFADVDDGVASFSLEYKDGSSPIDIDVYQNSDTLLRDDNSEPPLAFSPSGFTFTQSVLANPPPSPINDPIVTQVAGSDFNLNITAFGQTADDPDCGVIEAYDGVKPLSFWFDYENPSSGTLVPTIATNPITSSEGASSSQSVTFSSGQAVVIAKYKDVGQIQVHAKEGTIAGSTNSFVSKPADLFISDIETVPGVDNPGATSMISTRFVAAGETFTVVVQARDAENALTPNFGNESPAEGIEIVAALVQPVGGINGSANDGTIGNGANFSATTPTGTFTGSAFSWDEYGIITLQASIADDSYLGTGEISGTVSGNVGRFYAASYTLVSSSVAASCNGMTYMDEAAISASYNIEAQDVGNNKLANYDSALLGGNVVVPTFHAENNNQGTELNSRISLTSSSWNNGSYSLTSINQLFSRAGSPDGPYESLQLSVSINDTIDSFDIANADMNPATNTNCTSLGNCTAKALGSTTRVRYGRLEVSNNFGPETEPLDIALSVSYLNAAGSFVVNTDDDCSAYVRTNATLSNYQGGLPVLTVTSPISSTLFVDGKPIAGSPLLLSAPGAGNDGSVDVTFDAPSWLEYNWSGGGDEDPKATASFGHFRGHDKVIYWREVF